MKFRIKPLVIEAEQWFPPKDPRHNAQAHPVGCEVGKAVAGTIVGADFVGNGYQMKTLEGWFRLIPGDWIITGIQGELYPCKDEIFAASYEPVTP